MHLIVGLGNPGPPYTLNRHNAGFLALSFLAKKQGLDDPSRFKSSLIIKAPLAGCPAVLAWPQTYMNLSGDAVLELTNFYKVSKENVLILHDEMDMPLGRIKMACGGGTAGHNGLASILSRLGPDFSRLKIGIGRPPAEIFTQGHADYVLSNFLEPEQLIVEESLEDAAEAVMIWVTQGMTMAQNQINRRQPIVKDTYTSDGET